MFSAKNPKWLSTNNWKAATLMLISATAIATYPLLIEISDGEKWFLGFTAVVGAARSAGILLWGKIYAPEIHTLEKHRGFFRDSLRGDASQTKMFNKYMWFTAVLCRIASVGFVISAKWIEPAAGYLIYETSTVLTFLCLRLKDTDKQPNKTLISAKMSWLMIAAIMIGIWMVKIAETGKIDIKIHPAWFLIIAVGAANAFQIERSLKFGETASAKYDSLYADNLKTQTYWSSIFSAYASGVHALIFTAGAIIFSHHPDKMFIVAVVFAATLIAGPLSMVCRRAANNRSDRLDIEGIRRLAPVIAVGLIWLADKADLVQLGIANWMWFSVGAAIVVVCSFWANVMSR